MQPTEGTFVGFGVQDYVFKRTFGSMFDSDEAGYASYEELATHR